MWFNHGFFAVTLVCGMGDRIYPGGLFCQFSVPNQMSYWDLHIITILAGDLICCKCQLGHLLQISLTVCCSCSHGNWIQYITSPNLAQRCYGWSQMEQPCFLYWLYYNIRAQESTNWGKKKSLNCLASLYCHQSAFITAPLLLGIIKDLWYFSMVCMFSAASSMWMCV